MSGNGETDVVTNGHAAARPTLNSAVLRRRADREFFLRLRDVMQQNHRALERLGR